MNSVCLSVRPSVHPLFLANVLQMFLNLQMLFISDIEWSVLKMSFMLLKVRLQGHTKIFRCITAYGKKISNRVNPSKAENFLKSNIFFMLFSLCFLFFFCSHFCHNIVKMTLGLPKTCKSIKKWKVKIFAYLIFFFLFLPSTIFFQLFKLLY